MGVFVVFGLVKPVTPVLALRNFMCLAVIPKVLKELGVSYIHVPWPLTLMSFSFKRSPSLIPWRPPSVLLSKRHPSTCFFSKGPSTANVESMEELLSWFEKSWIRNLPSLNVVTIPNLVLFGLMDAFLGQCMPPHMKTALLKPLLNFLTFKCHAKSLSLPSGSLAVISTKFLVNFILKIFVPLEDICSAWHGTSVCLGEPTRWEGHREIDFFITSFPEDSSKVSSLPVKVSDHKILSITFQCPSHTKETVRYKKGPVFSIPDSCTSEAWRNALSTAWGQVDREHNITNRIGHNDWDVQSQWDLLQHGLIETFVRSTQHFEPNTRFSPSRIVAKGAVASFVVNSPHVNGAEPQLGHMAERKLRRRLARHYELMRLKKR